MAIIGNIPYIFRQTHIHVTIHLRLLRPTHVTSPSSVSLRFFISSSRARVARSSATAQTKNQWVMAIPPMYIIYNICIEYVCIYNMYNIYICIICKYIICTIYMYIIRVKCIMYIYIICIIYVYIMYIYIYIIMCLY